MNGLLRVLLVSRDGGESVGGWKYRVPRTYEVVWTSTPYWRHYFICSLAGGIAKAGGHLGEATLNAPGYIVQYHY